MRDEAFGEVSGSMGLAYLDDRSIPEQEVAITLMVTGVGEVQDIVRAWPDMTGDRGAVAGQIAISAEDELGILDGGGVQEVGDVIVMAEGDIF